MVKILKKNKILFLIHLPPPVHGVSCVNKNVISAPIFDDFDKKYVKLNFSSKISDLQKITFFKFVKSIVVFYKLLYNLIFFRPKIIYFSLFPFGKAFFLRDVNYLFLIKLFNKKIILHLHNIGIEKESYKKIKQKIYNLAFSNLNIIFLSKTIKDKEISNLSLRNTNYFIISNGIKSIDLYRYKNIKNDNKYLNILFFSNFFKEKGVFILLNVFEELLNKYNNIRLIISGQDFDNNEQKIKKFILTKKLTKKVNIKTNVFDNDKYKLYSEADIFVFPSYFYETSSLVVMDAMQFGLPIVASSTGVIPELLIDNKTAILFSSKNKMELEKKISILIDDKELRDMLGKNARNYFLQNYTLDIFYKKIFQMINTVANE